MHNKAKEATFESKVKTEEILTVENDILVKTVKNNLDMASKRVSEVEVAVTKKDYPKSKEIGSIPDFKNTMNDEEQKHCLNLLKKYKSLKDCKRNEKKKQKIKEELYNMLSYWIMVYIKSILRKWYRRADLDLIKDFTADIFLYGLKLYSVKFDTPVTYFFYKYTRYYLLDYYNNRKKRIDCLDMELVDLDEVYNISDMSSELEYKGLAIDRILSILSFRDMLPENYVIAFDHSFEWFIGEKSCNYSESINIHEQTYWALRNIFKIIIKILIK